MFLQARKSVGVKESLWEQPSDIGSVCNCQMIFFHKRMIRKYFANQIMTIFFRAVDFNRINISTVPHKVAFIHAPQFTFWGKQDRLKEFLSTKSLRHACTKFTCCRIKQYRLLTVILHDGFETR